MSTYLFSKADRGSLTLNTHKCGCMGEGARYGPSHGRKGGVVDSSRRQTSLRIAPEDIIGDGCLTSNRVCRFHTTRSPHFAFHTCRT